MNKSLRFLLCVVIITCQSYLTHASHIVGGEMTYQCLGNNDYLVTLKVYRDCFNGAAPYDDPTNVFVFDQSGNIVATLPIPFPGSDTLPNNANNPCLIVPPGICVEEAIFTYTVNLPPSTGGYTMIYQRCCRNYSISNILDPSNTGATFLGTIPDPATADCNSSPYFNNFPPTVICVNEPLVFDHSATDPDGDSLVYNLCDPYLGAGSADPYPNPPAPPPYGFVTFLAPYSAADPMGGSPPMAINSETGELTVTPNTIGQFVVGVCVSEYRNGVFLSEHKRDFQFNVTTCQPSVVASIPNVINNCSSATVFFDNNSFGGFTYHWDFGVNGSTSDTSNLFSPTFTYPDTGVYTVTLIVNPGTNCGDTTTATVYIYPTLVPGILAPDGCVGQPVQFTDQSTSTYGVLDSWDWSFGDGNNGTQQSPSHIFSTPGDYTVQLVVGNSVGCVDTIEQTITIFPSPTIDASPEDTIICYLDVVHLVASANGATNYSWQPNYNLTNPNVANPTASPDVSVTYTVTVSNSYGCVATDTVHITVFDTLVAFAGEDTVICPGGSVQLNATGGINFSWSPPNGLSSTTIPNPVANPAQTTTYVLTTSVGSCIGTDAVTVFVKPLPVIVAGPDQSICQGDSVQITAFGGTSYTWSPSATLTNPNISDPYAFPIATTTYTVNATNADSCPAVGQDELTVSVIPIPPIFLQPGDTTIHLGTSVTLSITGGASYVWVPSTGLDDPTSPTPVASPTETTTYYVYITTSDGCPAVDSMTIVVNPEPLVIFPTAFSPDGNGKNDFFRPVILGLAHLDEFRIFNRWGQEVFADNNVNVIGGPLPENLSWDGSFKGQDQPVGVYVYFLKGVASATGTTITLQGNFTLVR